MQVQRVQNNNYNQPAFSGYISKKTNIHFFKKGWRDNSLQNRIVKIIEKECENLIDQANKQHQPINSELVNQYKEQGKRVLGKWNQFMHPLDKNTGLFLVDWLPRDRWDRKFMNSFLAIRNPIMGGQYKIVARPFADTKKAFFTSTPSSSGFPYMIPTLAVNSKKAMHINAPYDIQKIETLDSLENTVDILLANIKPKDIDTQIFERAKRQFIESVEAKDKFNFIERMVLKQKAKKIDKYAENQGLDAFAKEYIEHIFNTIDNNNGVK